jgi:protein-L-isoaspartate(D-aspartate) O-methyltransferase
MNLPKYQLEGRGIKDPQVLSAIRQVPRELFVPPSQQELAYADCALPIDCRQTISQPYIVAYMTETLQLNPTDIMLEIGTGSGYQTAVLAQLVKEVYTIEIYPELSQKAQKLLTSLGYQNIFYQVGDGSLGCLEKKEFDAIILTAASKQISSSLLKQLKSGGRMILPLETEGVQKLCLVSKSLKGEISHQWLLPVRFVPLL